MVSPQVSEMLASSGLGQFALHLPPQRRKVGSPQASADCTTRISGPTSAIASRAATDSDCFRRSPAEASDADLRARLASLRLPPTAHESLRSRLHNTRD